jgi:hypothetical protein
MHTNVKQQIRKRINIINKEINYDFVFFSDVDNESTEQIPCEYCNASISIQDWEWHSVIK